MKKEEAIDDILYLPYAYGQFDEEDIISRLKCMVPEKMFCFFHSKGVQKLKDKCPEKFT